MVMKDGRATLAVMSGPGLKLPTHGATASVALGEQITAATATMHGSLQLEAAKYTITKQMMNGSSQTALETKSITIQSGHGVITITSGTYGTTITTCGLYLNMELFSQQFESFLSLSVNISYL